MPAARRDPGIRVLGEHFIWQIWDLFHDLICQRAEELLVVAFFI